jgi:hypothetical protein
MKEVMTQIFFGIVAIVAIIGIKMMYLPEVITVLLVLIIFLVAIYGIAGGFTQKKSLKKKIEETESSINDGVFNSAKKI